MPERTSSIATALSGASPKQVPVLFDNLPSALGQIRGGNVRMIAVTGRDRPSLLADVPTNPALFVAPHESAIVKVFGCRPHTSPATHTGGRRPKTSKGRNRGKGHGTAVPPARRPSGF